MLPVASRRTLPMTRQEQTQGSDRKAVLSVGYVVLDVLVHRNGLGHSAGGTAGNVAANLSYFGWDATTAALHGDDPAGDHLRADLVKAGVSSRGLLRRKDFTTPVVIHEVSDGSHRFRFGCPECGRKFAQFRAIPVGFAEDLVESNKRPDVLFLDRVSAAAVLMAERVRDSGGLVVFEPSMPGNSPRFRRLLELAHLVKFSASRLDPTSGLLDGSPGTHVYTDGANGAYWRRNGRSWNHVPRYAVDVIDAGGAGDWTTAALLDALPSLVPDEVKGSDLTGPLRYAQAVAALSCQVLGARGLASEGEREILEARVASLQQADRHRRSARTGRPSRSRRSAACTACLSRASGMPEH